MILAAAGGRALWYLTRGTGLVTLVLLTSSVVLGIVTSVRWQSPRWPRFVTAALHRNVSLLVLALLSIHIATAVIDGFAPIRWLDAVIPYGSAYRPLWLGFGALAFDLLLAVTATSLLRQRIGYRAWRVVHWAAYACWPVALLHGLGTGTDTRLGWVLALNLACLAAVIAAVWWRLASVRTPREGAWAGAAVASVLVPLAVLGWLVLQPLRPGWARRAGTPPSLLARTASATPAGAAPAGAPPAGSGPVSGPVSGAPPPADAATLEVPFTSSFRGTIRQQTGDPSGAATVDISGTLSDGASGALRVVLQGTALEGGGIEMSSGSATLGPPSRPTLYRGTVIALRGAEMVAQMQRPGGGVFDISIRLRIDEATNTVTGIVQAGGREETGGDDG